MARQSDTMIGTPEWRNGRRGGLKNLWATPVWVRIPPPAPATHTRREPFPGSLLCFLPYLPWVAACPSLLADPGNFHPRLLHAPRLLATQKCSQGSFHPSCRLSKAATHPKLLHAQDCLLIRAAFAHAAAHPELQPAQGCYPPKAAAYPRSTLESLKTPMRPYTSLYTPIRRCKSRDMRLPSRNELLCTIFWNKKPSFRTGVAKRSKFSSSIETESR